jgi:hypothetical protein
MHRVRSPFVIIVGALAIFIARPGNTAEIDWQVAPYLWAADVGLDLAINSDPVLGTTVPFSDIVDKLDSAFMFHAEGIGSDSNIGGFVDVITLSLSDSSITTVGPGGPILGDLVVAADLSMNVYEGGGILRFGDQGIDRAIMDIVLGIRYVNVEQNLNITLPAPGSTPIDRRIKVSELDAMIGLRVLGRFTDRFGYHLRGDISDLGTDGIVNLLAGVNYGFGRTQSFSMELGYRYMSMDLSGNLNNGATSSSELILAGPVLGFVFSF